jgi:hypothetical protein
MPTGAVTRLPLVLAFARREPSAILLGAQLAGVLLYPFMEGSDVVPVKASARSVSMIEQLAGLSHPAAVTFASQAATSARCKPDRRNCERINESRR